METACGFLHRQHKYPASSVGPSDLLEIKARFGWFSQICVHHLLLVQIRPRLAYSSVLTGES